MNNVHEKREKADPMMMCLRGATRLLAGTALLIGLCILLADPDAPRRALALLLTSI
jgi:hypothetical protein